MPDWDEAAIAAAAGRVRLTVNPRRRRQGSGTRLGAGPGASLEFFDYRGYVAGDDLRHLDWGVYARSEQLVLRRHRQEVSPRVEVVLDCSASMALSPAKLALATALAALFATLAEVDGGRPHLWALGTAPRRIGGAAGRGAWRGDLRALAAGGAAGFELVPLPPLGLGADRILVGDGLCPGGGAQVVRRFGQGAGRLCLVQVLCREEAAPRPLGAVRLEDVEGGAADLVHDEAACAAYRERFARHQGEWQSALAGRGAGVVTCLAEDGLDAALKTLLAAGVVEVKGA